MTQSGVRGELARPRVRQAQDLGRDARPRENTESDGGGDGSDAGDRRRGGRRRPRGKRGILRWSAITLSVLILGTAGAGYFYYWHLNNNISKGERSSGDSNAKKAEPNSAGQTPLNILLIGSDSRNTEENVQLGGSRGSVGSKPRGDVQMLIHLSAGRKHASVVSVPRDTRVDIPECRDPETGETYPATNDIINASLARGGAGCTLAAWENLTGAYIDHWMTIDFAGVVRMADAIGGVEVCVEQNLWDRALPGIPGGSGLKLKAGKQKVQGGSALQWLRTRHAFYSDLGRAKAQHMYLNSMIRTLKKQNVFTDTGRLTSLAEAATNSLTVSEEIGSVDDLYGLGMQLKTVPTDRITMTTMPTVVDPQDPNHLVPDGADAEQVWTMIRDDVAFDNKGRNSDAKKKPAREQASDDPAAEDGEIGVVVQNGTRSSTLAPVGGRANAVSQVLVRKGFSRATADRTVTLAEDRTVVRYPSAELEGDAQHVAKSLGIPLSSVKRTTDVSGVTLVVGADWREGTAYPKQSEPEAGDVPETAGALNGADSGTCMPVYKPYRW